MATTRRLPFFVSLALGALLVSACGNASHPVRAEGPESVQRGNPDDLPYAADLITRSGRFMGTGARTVEELLPNAQLQVGLNDYRTFTDTVVVATPMAVTPNRAVMWEVGPDGDREIEVDFESARAQGRYWNVQLQVEAVVAGDQPSEALPGAENDIIQVPLFADGGSVDAARFESGLLALRRTVWFLRAALRSEGASRDEFRIAWNGAAVAQVTTDGALVFPFVPDELKQVARGYTLGEIEALAQREPYRVEREVGER